MGRLLLISLIAFDESLYTEEYTHIITSIPTTWPPLSVTIKLTLFLNYYNILAAFTSHPGWHVPYVHCQAIRVLTSPVLLLVGTKDEQGRQYLDWQQIAKQMAQKTRKNLV